MLPVDASQEIVRIVRAVVLPPHQRMHVAVPSAILCHTAQYSRHLALRTGQAELLIFDGDAER